VSTSNAELALGWQARVTSLPEPVTEVPFDPVRRWRFDMARPAHKVAVEIEGGSWTNARHSRGSGFEADCEKYNAAALLGWIVLRVTPRMIDDGRALRLIEQAIELQET
jgi:very-short-patch-repair endonuclease